MQQRSPLIFWLLLAATIAVDLVVFSQTRLASVGSIQLEVLQLALVFAQLSAACIGIVAVATTPAIRALVAAAAIALAILGLHRSESHIQYIDAAMLVGIHSTSMLFALWLLKLLLARRGGNNEFAQFSMKSIFAVMTAVAVVASLARAASLFHENRDFTIGFQLTNVLLPTAAFILWRRKWHWILRMAATFAAALSCGWLLSVFQPQPDLLAEELFCIEAAVLIVWLTFGQIIPAHSAPAGDAVPTSSST